MIIVGIDIGVEGAIAVLSDAVLIEVHDMPCLSDGPNGRRRINAPLLSDIIANSHAERAYVEWVGVRPGEGAVGAFAFGRAAGVVEGICAGLSVPVEFITSPAWKRLVGIPPGKDGVKNLARSKAIARWPDRAALFARVRDDGRAESALIAVAGLARAGA
jgi:crossover junction endodeoxyribonuclease RuvC